MLHAALWKSLPLILIAHLTTLVRYGCLFIAVRQVLRLKFLPESLILPLALPEAISSRASSKMSSTSRGKASLAPGALSGCQSFVMWSPVGLVLRMYLGFGGPTRLGLGFGLSFGFSRFGQDAPCANTVLVVDCSCSFVDDIFLDDVEGLLKLSDCAHVELGIMNLHC